MGKIYSILTIIQILIIELNHIASNYSLSRSLLVLLIIPVIYHLILELFFKNKQDQNKALKIYAFIYVCFYALWCLLDIMHYALNMGHISGYMAYMLYLTGMLLLSPVLYIFAKNIFPNNKTPLYIFIAYVALIFILSTIPEELNERGFYGTTSNQIKKIMGSVS